MAPAYSIIAKYQNILKDHVKIKFSNSKNIFGEVGVINRLFCFHLCSNQKIFTEFCREISLIKSDAYCDKCNHNMRLISKNNINDLYMWRCGKVVNKKRCQKTKSIRYNSWFSCSKLSMEEIFLLTYEILSGSSTRSIMNEYGFSSFTCADWRQLVNEKILDIVEVKSEKIGGKGVVVEVGESKFEKRKFHKREKLEGEWVYGGIEKGTGKVFLVTVPERSSEYLLKVIQNWIEPGTTIYSNCWKSHNCLKDDGFQKLLNDNISFIDKEFGSPVESAWRHARVNLPEYNRRGECKFYLAIYLFYKMCSEIGVDSFNVFLDCLDVAYLDITDIKFGKSAGKE